MNSASSKQQEMEPTNITLRKIIRPYSPSLLNLTSLTWDGCGGTGVGCFNCVLAVRHRGYFLLHSQEKKTNNFFRMKGIERRATAQIIQYRTVLTFAWDCAQTKRNSYHTKSNTRIKYYSTTWYTINPIRMYVCKIWNLKQFSVYYVLKYNPVLSLQLVR